MHFSAPDFNRNIDRRYTDSVKWAGAGVKFGADVFPMWVADMDFASADCILAALHRRLQNPVFGYPDHDQEAHLASVDWWQKKYDWAVAPEEIILVQGVVPALFAAVRAFSGPGDGIVVMPPIYPPFFAAVENQERRLLSVPLLNSSDQGRYEIDFPELMQKLPGARMLLLCSPHNPVGRVWEPKDLQNLVELCRLHGVQVVSDEIHADLTSPECRHTPLGLIDPGSIVLASASKSFNIPGLGGAVAWIRDPEQKAVYVAELRRSGVLGANTMAKSAMVAAWREGEPWLQALRQYLDANLRDIAAFLCEEIPAIRFSKPEFGYLAWLDLRALGWSDSTIQQRLVAAGLGLSPGPSFGHEGSGFVRLNYGTTGSYLRHGLELLRQALAQ